MSKRIKGITIEIDGETKGLDKALSDVNKRSRDLQKELRDVDRLLKFNPGNADLIAQKQKLLSQEVENTRDKLNRLKDAKADVDRQFAEGKINEKQYDAFQREIIETESKLQHFETQLATSKSKLHEFGETMTKAGDTMKQAGDKVTSVGKDLTKKVTAPIVGLGALATKSAIDFESAFAGVRKTVDATEEEFENLSTGIRDMAKEIPAAATEIAGVAEAAGQLGIKKEAILGFTRTMVDLGVATNMSSEEAAMALARLANITNMNQQDFDRLGSSVVGLGNNFAATEGEIVNMALRLAGAGSQVGMSEADILGLSAALASVGIEAEMGGSAISKAMIRMQVASTTGFEKMTELTNKTGHSVRELQMMASHSGKAFGHLAEDLGMTKTELTALVNAGVDLENFAKIAGVTGEQFAQSFEKDAVGALGAFINGLGNADEAGESAINMLQEMGISEVRLRDSLLRAGNASELFAEAVDVSNESWKENVALTNEAEQRYATTASQLQIMVNFLKDLGITIGAIVLPVINSLIGKMKPLIEKFSDMSSTTQKTILAIAGIAAAIGPLLLVIGLLVTSLGGILTAIGTFSGALAVVTTGAAAATPAVGALATMFTFLTGPIGIAIAAIVGIVAAFVLAYNKVEWFREGVQNVFGAIKDVITTAIGSVVNFLSEKLSYIQAFWADNGQQIQHATENVWNAIKAVIGAVMPAIQAIISVVWKVIQVVIMSVWDNIKGVISGALDIILGLVKTFSSLFTGDWQGMWEGIKQMFSGAIEFLWNAIQLMLWGRMLKGIAAFAGTFRTAATSMWTSIQGVFTNSINAIRTFFSNGFNAMKSVADVTMGSIRTVISTIWNTIKTVFSTVINSIKTTISTGFGNVVTAIRTKMADAVTAVRTQMAEMLGKVKGAAKDFLQAGKDLISGLINGIKEMTASALGAITGVVDSVVDKAKALLGIHSPSRVFMGIGGDTIKGWEIGMGERKKNLESVMKDLTNGLLDITNHYKSEDIKINKSANAEISKIKKRSAEDITKIHSGAKAKKRKITQDEAIKIQRIEEDSAKKIVDIEKKAMSDRVKLLEEADSEKLKEIKLFIENKKSLDQLALVDEAILWEKSVKQFADGTKEKVEAQKGYQAALKAVNDEITKTNDEYAGKMTAINDRLKKAEEDLTNAYETSLKNRTDSLRNFAGIFDEIDVTVKRSGSELLANLQEQVSAFATWQGQIDLLATKAIDGGLLAELREMGPKALPELLALNSMTEAQLSQYSGLYVAKSALARQQAEKELVGMKADTQTRIAELRAAANTELEALRAEWIKKIKSITKASDDELKSLKQIGVNAGQGLLNGLASMEGALVEKARSIANAVSAAMATALQVKSPSRVTMRIGEFVGEGLAAGMENTIASIHQAAKLMGSAAILDVGEFNVPQFSGGNIKSVRAVPDGDTYTGPIYVNIDGKDFDNMRDIADFFGALQQARRAH